MLFCSLLLTACASAPKPKQQTKPSAQNAAEIRFIRGFTSGFKKTKIDELSSYNDAELKDFITVEIATLSSYDKWLEREVANVQSCYRGTKKSNYILKEHIPNLKAQQKTVLDEYSQGKTDYAMVDKLHEIVKYNKDMLILFIREQEFNIRKAKFISTDAKKKGKASVASTIDHHLAMLEPELMKIKKYIAMYDDMIKKFPIPPNDYKDNSQKPTATNRANKEKRNKEYTHEELLAIIQKEREEHTSTKQWLEASLQQLRKLNSTLPADIEELDSDIDSSIADIREWLSMVKTAKFIEKQALIIAIYNGTINMLNKPVQAFQKKYKIIYTKAVEAQAEALAQDISSELKILEQHIVALNAIKQKHLKFVDEYKEIRDKAKAREAQGQ